jgi:hypothetical protein
MHGGKTHMQTFYVKVGDVHKTVQTHARIPKSSAARDVHTDKVDTHVESLHGDANVAARFIHGWVHLGSGSMDALAYRHALADAGHLTHEAHQRDLHRRAAGSRSTPERYIADAHAERQQLIEALHHSATERGEESSHEHQQQRMADTAHALVVMSQAAHPEPTVTVYRGVRADQAAALRSADHLAVDGLSSWSENPDIARRFASASRGGAVLRIEVPREHIMLSHRTGHYSFDHLHNEQEVVIASPSGRIPITSQNLVEVEDDGGRF